MLRRKVAPYAATLLAVCITLVAVGIVGSHLQEPAIAILLYLVPVVLAASQWGRGPAIVAVAAALLLQDFVLAEPRWAFAVNRPDEAFALLLLLFTAVVTAHLADRARTSGIAVAEAAIARRSEEMKTTLLRAVTHDLRTPLTSIKGSVSALRQPEAHFTAADAAELLANVDCETDRLNRLIENLLDASRLANGQLVVHPQPQDIGEVVGAAVDQLAQELQGRVIDIDIPADLPCVACDDVQIEQVFVNLLDNGARHTPPGTSIRITASVQGDMVEVQVSDDGPGIPMTDRVRVFAPFERGPTSAAGTGLGLAIARGFVQAHGGTLWLAADSKEGASFRFTLPCWSNP